MNNPDVLIVGAGPTGLALGIELSRRGNSIRIVDKHEGTAVHSKAFGVHSRTQEILDIMGVGDDFQKFGYPKAKIIFHMGRVCHYLHMDSVDSPYKSVMSLPQSDSEEILYKHLKDGVEWETEVVGCIDDEYLLLKDGQQEKVKPKWVVGCDGAKSFIRHSNSIPFGGKTFNKTFYMQDVTGKTKLTTDAFHIIFNGKKPSVMLFPFNETRLRIISLGSDKCEQVAVEKQYWSSQFIINSRHVPKLHFKNIFLAGDAAHIHSPAGGQGMNTSIQDAFNLGWKLDLVLKGAAPKSLLDSYEKERMPVIKQLIRMTEGLTKVVFFMPYPIKFVLTHLLMFALKVPGINRKMAANMAQLKINYRQSPIVQESDPSWSGPRAGDRLPDAVLHDGSRVYDFLKGNTKHLVLLMRENEQIATYIKQKLGKWIDVHVLCCDRLYNSEPDSLYVIRPDGYIGYRERHASLKKLEGYLNSCFLITE